MKRNSTIRDAMSFDDVLLQPAETAVKPADAKTKSRLTRDIDIDIPLVSAPVDNVTESAMAIRMAQLGGIGFIHSNMPLGKQVEEVRKVKKAEGQMTENPITLSPESSAAEAFDIMTSYKVSCLPVIDPKTQIVVGVLTARDMRFFDDYAAPISSLMANDPVTVVQGTPLETIKKLMHEKRVNKVIITDTQGRAVGITSARDIEKMGAYPQATRDTKGMLRVGAAVGIGKDAVDRTLAMADAGLDVVMIDVAHAHTKEAINTVSRIRQQRSTEVQIIAGNVVTPDAARRLVDAGADAIKVGMGALATSSSRRIGIGMPQLTALIDVAQECEMMNVPVIADGGLSSEANVIKALAAGANIAMINDIFAGTEEAPGEIFYHEALAYKIINAAARPQRRPPAGIQAAPADVYHMDDSLPDTTVPYRGPVVNIVDQLVQSIKMAMAYTGSEDMFTFRENSVFVRIK